MVRDFITGLMIPGQATATAVARVKLEQQSGFEESSLAYGRNYLDAPTRIALNPEYLPLQADVFESQPRRTRDGGALHLTLKDALPDAWGRLVVMARNDGQRLSDVDILLQTNSDRVGAMVFADDLATVPSLDLSIASYELRELADAARELEYGMEVPSHMKRLLCNGGSLGGARPKASIVRDGQLWMAKFPAKDDELDVQLLEASTLQLARQCGISTPDFTVVALGKIHALLLRRFDRPGSVESNERIHFLSAAAFTNSPYESDAGSYVGLAEHLRLHGSNIHHDLAQLFRRMVFNMVIDNSDDHVKNHGVLHTGNNQYALSPAYDLVPQLTNLGYLGMGITEGKMEAHLDQARAVAGHFGLTHQAADQIIKDVSERASHWRPLFESMGMNALALRRVDACFSRQMKLISD